MSDEPVMGGRLRRQPTAQLLFNDVSYQGAHGETLDVTQLAETGNLV
ncbi:MAG: hypothetical protein AAB198_00915 [Actinomycetota bacterium]